MEREIIVLGRQSDRTPEETQQWIKENIAAKFRKRYRRTRRINADTVVLSYGGIAYGHFDVEPMYEADERDKREFAPAKFTCIVRARYLYRKPVRLLTYVGLSSPTLCSR
jgi:hypothetical protein